jgi:hypothetical protein
VPAAKQLLHGSSSPLNLSHLLLVFRHWSQAEGKERGTVRGDGDGDGTGSARTPATPFPIGCFCWVLVIIGHVGVGRGGLSGHGEWIATCGRWSMLRRDAFRVCLFVCFVSFPFVPSCQSTQLGVVCACTNQLGSGLVSVICNNTSGTLLPGVRLARLPSRQQISPLFAEWTGRLYNHHCLSSLFHSKKESERDMRRRPRS